MNLWRIEMAISGDGGDTASARRFRGRPCDQEAATAWCDEAEDGLGEGDVLEVQVCSVSEGRKWQLVVVLPSHGVGSGFGYSISVLVHGRGRCVGMIFNGGLGTSYKIQGLTSTRTRSTAEWSKVPALDDLKIFWVYWRS
ncbi:hypothetical protein PanWU01x14_010270 [Parasponia andersonii]|uniref:Uncharacterized protein n=1 Tax=Parasponia andersonii TaxID=3476 RepID=A0A2P5E2M2_PARAD|nr:hypothetical protein PanWU01x14_010270 [Parasponia andersonii]